MLTPLTRPRSSGVKPLKAVMNGQRDARLTVTFPVAKRHHPLTGTMILLVTR